MGLQPAVLDHQQIGMVFGQHHAVLGRDDGE